MKLCTKCLTTQPLDRFEPNRDQCKSCVAIRKAVHYKKNKDKVAEQKKEYYEQNADLLRAKRRKYYSEHKDEIKLRSILHNV